MKIGAVILVAGVGIPDEEMEKFLEMKRPTIFEQMIVSYQRAGVADIALVTRDGMADKIEQTLHRRGVTFLDIESDSFELAVLKGLSYLSDTCERIFIGDIRFPFFQPDILVMMQKRQAELRELMEKNIAFKAEATRLLQQAENDAYAPLKAKINEEAKKIGKQKGFAFILNTDNNAAPYLNEEMGENITALLEETLK